MMDVLYIDDEKALLDVCKAFLELSGDMTVETTTSVKGARTLMAEKRFDAIISDYQMPEMNGIDFLKILRSQGNGIPFILFTGKGREEVVIEALNSGADFYLQKGGNPTAQFKELEYKVKEAVRRIRAESALKMNEARLSKAQAIGQIGSWEYTWNGASGMLWGSDESWRIFGMPRPSDGTIGWSKIAERIVAYKTRGVNLFLLGFLHYLEDVEYFGAEILPLVREREADLAASGKLESELARHGVLTAR